MKKLLLIVAIFISYHSTAQSEDSTQVMPFDDFYSMVIDYHPVVQQARLLPQNAQMEIRLARGGFDPKLEGSWDFKEFKETEYYNNGDISLKIPTWFPIDPKVGIERNRGNFLNPENFISDNTNNRQVYAGVSVPIGQGLFIDQRRATVKKARLMQGMAEAEQIKEINKVLLTAVKDYWQWYYAYNNYQLILQSINIAQDIFDRTTLAFQYGEAAAIDTVQAKIALQSRQVDFQQANIERISAMLTLSNHLWSESGIPLELANDVRPEDPLSDTFDDEILGELATMARQNHPELRKLDLKNESLFVDKSLARENLKPRLDLDYFLLDQPLAPNGDNSSVSFNENYKVGLAFEFPIFLRKERAKLNKIDLKIQENSFSRTFREREILNDISIRFNTILATGTILQQQQDMVNNYQLILDAERLNLQNGESDLFKINIQFEKLINSQTKLFKLRSEYQKDIAGLYWAAGIANLGYQ